MSVPYIRVPPDGAGKRIAMVAYLNVDYSDLTGDLEIGDAISGSTSGVLGHIIHVMPMNASSGEMYILLDHDVATAVVNGETLTAEGSPPTGTCTAVGTGTVIQVPQSILVGGNNPFFPQHVDVKGAASVRFSSGTPYFDAFGGQKVSDPNTIGVYEFSSDGGFGLFSDEVTGVAEIDYNTTTSCVHLMVTTAATDSAIRTSNKNHYYWPGNGTSVIMSASFTDLGVVGCTKRLGFFDVNDGVFFEQDGTTMYAVLRSSVTGTPVDVRIPQSEWSHDRLDGTGLSGVHIDWAKQMVFWLDLQWLGAGKVRLGIVGPDGVHIVVHEFQNSGKNNYPYMKTASLPVRAEVVNHALLGAGTQLRLTCIVVKCDGKIDYTYYRDAATHGAVTVNGANVHLMSLRASPTYGGRKNPVNAYPEEYNCYVKDGVVRLDLCWPITMTGYTWADDRGAIQVDYAASGATVDADYWLYASYYLSPGTHKIDLRGLSENNDEGIIFNADGTFWPFNLVATKIGATDAVIEGALTWKELR